MSLLEDLHSLLEKEWSSIGSNSERDCKNSLVKFLHDRNPSLRVEPEYRDKGTTVDVFVERKGFFFPDQVYCEIKFNLQRKTDYDRLVGQIYGLKPGKCQIIIVLCGATTPPFIQRLKDEFQAHMESVAVWDSPPNIRIIVK